MRDTGLPSPFRLPSAHRLLPCGFLDKEVFMIRTAILAAGLGVVALSPAHGKGCIKGAVVGGVAGHMAGHGKMGAAAGCAVGHHHAAKKAADKQGQ